MNDKRVWEVYLMIKMLTLFLIVMHTLLQPMQKYSAKLLCDEVCMKTKTHSWFVLTCHKYQVP